MSTVRVHALIDGLGVGGAEMLLPELAAVAPQAGIELTVGALIQRGPEPAGDRLRDVGVVPSAVGVTKLGPQAVLQVRRHLAQVRPDVVHTHLGYSDLLGTAAARSLRLPSVATLHAMQWGRDGAGDKLREALMTGARRWCADRVIAVSDTARAQYLAQGRDKPERVVVVRNGVRGTAAPAGAGAAVRAELGLGPDDLVVSVVAALRPEKAHDVAVETVRRLRERDARIKLLVAGDGPTRDEVERLVATLGEGAVMAGYRSDVMAVLDATDVLLHPAHYDALPTTLIEAAAASVPVVATRVGGIPEIVEDGTTGVLVEPPPRAGAVEAALAPLLAEPERRRALGAAARERFEREFSALAWAQRLRAVYDDVLARY